MKNKKIGFIYYCVMQAFCWINLCIGFMFAAVFLQNRGYSNSELGTVLAIGSIVSAVFCTVGGNLLDKYKKISVHYEMIVYAVLELISVIIIIFVKQKSFILSFSYVLFVGTIIGASSGLTHISFDLIQWGNFMNYGVARGLGSMMTVPFSLIVGVLVEKIGSEIVGITLLIAAIGFSAGTFLLYLRFMKYGYKIVMSSTNSSETYNNTSIISFIRKYKKTCIFLLSLIFLYYTHYIMNCYQINVIREVGGDTSTLGYVSSYVGFLEFPAMLFFSKISKKFKVWKLLVFSGIMLFMKIFMITLSTSVPMLFVAITFHVAGFSILTPAIVKYIDDVIPRSDLATGQSLAYDMSIIATVFASYFGGILFDNLPVKTVLVITTILGIIGVAIMVIFIEKGKNVVSKTKA